MKFTFVVVVIFQRFYDVTDVFFDKSAIPDDLAPGYYKFDIRLTNIQKQLDSQLEIVGRLYN